MSQLTPTQITTTNGALVATFEKPEDVVHCIAPMARALRCTLRARIQSPKNRRVICVPPPAGCYIDESDLGSAVLIANP